MFKLPNAVPTATTTINIPTEHHAFPTTTAIRVSVVEVPDQEVPLAVVEAVLQEEAEVLAVDDHEAAVAEAVGSHT